jgi:hypothetical protein
MMACAIRPIDPKRYVPHALHRSERTWAESNCYIDVWIEVLHALGCEPTACLAFVLGIDWEGDQFTFFKPPLEDLAMLYGVDVQELNVYRSTLENAREQLRGGKIVLSEIDSYYLPDTAGTDYRAQHVKTTIGIQEIDPSARTLGYFHNSGYHVLRDADFVGLFRLDAPHDPTSMPLFAELVRTRRLVVLEERALVARSAALLRKHVARRPDQNPVARFADAFVADLERLKHDGLAAYHAYAFATIRQLGAAFELAAIHLRWLAIRGETALETSALAFESISESSKMLILKTARAVSANKAVEIEATLDDMAAQWARGMNELAARNGV